MRDPFLIRGPLRGPCSICGTPDNLTLDHVPPKGATRITAVEMRDLTARLSMDGTQGRCELSQDGVKFRSLCRRCNNERLGAETDPELVKLCNHADAVLRSRLVLPPSFAIDVRPMRALRSVVGQGVGEDEGRAESDERGEDPRVGAARGQTSPYDILGVRPNASIKEVELAYRARRAQYHPDKYATEDRETIAWATRMMQQVNEAYATLTN